MRYFAALLAAFALAATASAQEDLAVAYGAAAAGMRSGKIAGTESVPDAEPVLESPKDRPMSDELRAYLESLPAVDIGKHGQPDSPLTLVFIGSKSQIYHALRHAHWTGVPRSLPLSFVEGLGQLVTGRKITKFPPFHKYKIEGKTQNANWAVVVHSLTRRHHFRLWKLKGRDPYGRQVWWGSASYDTGIRWKGIIPVTHNTSPDIDAERDYIAQTLRGVPEVLNVGLVTLPQIPREGVNDQKDHYFTDGRALVVEFGRSIPPNAADPLPDEEVDVREP